MMMVIVIVIITVVVVTVVVVATPRRHLHRRGRAPSGDAGSEGSAPRIGRGCTKQMVDLTFIVMYIKSYKDHYCGR